MSKSIYTVTGSIRHEHNKRPVHGLLVEAWSVSSRSWDDDHCEKRLGCDLTNRDGSFMVQFCDKDLCDTCETYPDVYILKQPPEKLMVFTRNSSWIYLAWCCMACVSDARINNALNQTLESRPGFSNIFYRVTNLYKYSS